MTGDVTQIDLPRHQESGLRHVARLLGGVEGIAITWFSPRDVVRHPLVQRIVEAYDSEQSASDAVAPGPESADD